MALEGKTVLVTRALGQSGELENLLRQVGANVSVIPTIEILEPRSWEPVDSAIHQLQHYDFIVFTSTNAVDYFLSRSAAEMERFRGQVAAVGLQTARRLESRGVKADLVPQDFSAQGLLDTFPQDLAGVRILIPHAETANKVLPSELGDRGASVDAIVVYRNALPRTGGVQLRALLEAHAIDCISLTSGSTVRNLIRMLGGSDVLGLLKYPAIAVIGPATRQTALDLGVNVDIEPVSASVPELVEAICRYFG